MEIRLRFPFPPLGFQCRKPSRDAFTRSVGSDRGEIKRIALPSQRKRCEPRAEPTGSLSQRSARAGAPARIPGMPVGPAINVILDGVAQIVALVNVHDDDPRRLLDPVSFQYLNVFVQTYSSPPQIVYGAVHQVRNPARPRFLRKDRLTPGKRVADRDDIEAPFAIDIRRITEADRVHLNRLWSSGIVALELDHSEGFEDTERLPTVVALYANRVVDGRQLQPPRDVRPRVFVEVD